MRLKLILLALCCLPALANAEVYKWKDVNGNMIYSDKLPSGLEVQLEHFEGHKTPITGIKPAVAKDVAADNKAVADPNAKTTPEDALKAKKQKDDEAKARQEQCGRDRIDLANYSIGGRITKVNAAGEREYMTAEAIEKALSAAKEAVAKNCD